MPYRSNEAFFDAVKTYGTWARITESTYAVVTDATPTEVRDFLVQFLHPDDRIFVMKSGGSAAWRKAMPKNDWLKKFLPLV